MDELVAGLGGTKISHGSWEFSSDHAASAAFTKISAAFPDTQFSYIRHFLWIG